MKEITEIVSVRIGGSAGQMLIILIFLLISVFSFCGSFANVSYVDIMGKSV